MRPNRTLWLAYSKENLKRFPDRIERYKAFLREAYPKQEPFSLAVLARARQKHNLEVPLDELLRYGRECNWLTRDGIRFKNADVFCSAYNGVWLTEQKKREGFYD